MSQTERSTQNEWMELNLGPSSDFNENVAWKFIVARNADGDGRGGEGGEDWVGEGGVWIRWVARAWFKNLVVWLISCLVFEFFIISLAN